MRHSSPLRDLTPLFEPASVAVVGASDDPVKWGNWLARRALRGASRRAVYLVNRRGGVVMGTHSHRSLAELPETPELVVLAVPPAALESAMDEAIAAGTRAVVVITADGDAGGARDVALATRAREAGVILLGPNCLGIFDAAAELELVPNDLPRGSIGLLSQSGNLALEIGVQERRRLLLDPEEVLLVEHLHAIERGVERIEGFLDDLGLLGLMLRRLRCHVPRR